MKITTAQLIKIAPSSKARAGIFIDALNSACVEFEINTPARMAAFIANIVHESGSLRYVLEIASGDAYEGRKDLGNVVAGWGKKYKGRGLIQVTGYYNYVAMMTALDINCVEQPELLEQPINACRSAAYFWKSHGLNELADQGDFLKICIRINGRNKKTGLPNGWQERQDLHKLAKEAFNV